MRSGGYLGGGGWSDFVMGFWRDGAVRMGWAEGLREEEAWVVIVGAYL